MTKEWANKDRYHPRMLLPRGKAIVRTVPAWADRSASSGSRLAGPGAPVRLVRVTGQIGYDRELGSLSFVPVMMVGSVPLVVMQVVNY
jgi:hypothetical protein